MNRELVKCPGSEPMMTLDRVLYGMSYQLVDGRRVSPVDRKVRALW